MQLEEKDAEVERLRDLRELKDQDRDVAKMRLYAEGEDLVPDILKQTADHLVDKVTNTDLKFELDEADKDQLDIIAVRHQAEKDKAMKAVQVEIEEDLLDEQN